MSEKRQVKPFGAGSGHVILHKKWLGFSVLVVPISDDEFLGLKTIVDDLLTSKNNIVEVRNKVLSLSKEQRQRLLDFLNTPLDYNFQYDESGKRIEDKSSASV